MIKRSILVCAAVILAWHFAAPHMPRRFYSIPGMQRANYLHAQEFVHETPADTRVIVGSSMSDRLSGAALGRDHVKLTFPGGGPFTGLELIRGTGRRPPVVWIETNVILRDAEGDLLADALSPWRMKLREASLVFKEKGRPSDFGVGFAKAVVGKIPATGGSAPAAGALDDSVLDGIMEANRKHLSKIPDARDLADRVGRLGTHADELTRAGCKVVFFEMPVDASLRDLAEPAAIRKALAERFPAGKYHWLDLRRDVPWRTTDGIHLVPEEADDVVRRMLEFEKGLK